MHIVLYVRRPGDGPPHGRGVTLRGYFQASSSDSDGQGIAMRRRPRKGCARDTALLCKDDKHGELGCNSAPGQVRPVFSAIGRDGQRRQG